MDAPITKENVLDYIIACANALDKLAAHSLDYYVPVPLYWLLEEQERQSRVALSRFKQNSSYFMYRNKSGAWRNY